MSVFADRWALADSPALATQRVARGPEASAAAGSLSKKLTLGHSSDLPN